MKSLTGVIALMLALLFGVSNGAVAAEKAAAPAAPGPEAGRAAGGGCCTMWTNGLEPCKQFTTPCPGGGAAKKKDPVTEACNGKQLGDMVKVGGKNVKCEQRHIAVSDSGASGPKPIVVPIKK